MVMHKRADDEAMETETSKAEGKQQRCSKT
jgi:hypothetical protein